MSAPLADLSPSRHNSRLLNRNTDNDIDTKSPTLQKVPAAMLSPSATSTPDEGENSPMSSPKRGFSPVKYRLQEDNTITSSPPDSPAEGTVRINDGLTRAIGQMEQEAQSRSSTHQTQDEHMSTIYRASAGDSTIPEDGEGDNIDFTLDLTQGTQNFGGDETIGDLSSISAIPPDMTRFANLRNSPTKSSREQWSPSKQLRGSVLLNTPGTAQRPLQLLSRTNSINEENEETPRRPRDSNDSPTDLLNFTGQTNVLIPPPGSAPRTSRRSPSGRGAFPIKVNPTPTHRAQASVDRERAGGKASDKSVPATPSQNRHAHRHSMFGAPNGLGMDLLDLDMEPMATPRSIPTVTPRELESLRSELQSKISGLEATLSGKEAEVKALTRAITDAEVRAGKVSEELRGERAAREEVENSKEEMERRSREMEEVLREIKQNAFVEEREREKLKRQIEEADRNAEEAEVRILELNSSLDALRSDRLNSTPSPAKHPSTPGATIDVDTAVKNATESVARELHALYKTKHERKVADLKVSYEKRWIKQVEQLRADLKASQDEVVKLQTEKEATMSGVIPGQGDAIMKMEGQIEELRRWNEDLTAQKKVVEAESAGCKSQIETLMTETDSLRSELEQERVEKGELVVQIDEFLLLKAEEEEIQAERARTQAQLQQPVSPPRSEDGNNTRPHSVTSIQSPGKSRNSATSDTPATGRTPGRPRPMSMLQAPKGGKFSGIPAPGSGLKAPSNVARNMGYSGRSGGLMEGIARMGAGGR
ncbi:uncharacterized protein HMPREF1541_00901 [Cyphellophora europaea CBS 101466]|uniref:Uncharacterized protein n=1 Tax=Cyphellophora europaea (strain CBS 101466) TaxID=1220924 RepID=W2SF95_CYPE1|nr:uncharacterized protein HMPREF1541_00901 [Cyphellophora europaea CBS 101466]ETN46713.1 hypothetical protein HMPREF1541_00901 [Cyphellophora europaea CBS 101466]